MSVAYSMLSVPGRTIYSPGDPNRKFRVADLGQTCLCPVCLGVADQLFSELEHGSVETGREVVACSVCHAQRVLEDKRDGK